MGLKSMVFKLLVRKLAPKILGRFAPRLMGSIAPRLMGKSYGHYGYTKYGYKPKSRSLLGGLKKLLKKLT
jgi:hypothetical protein